MFYKPRNSSKVSTESTFSAVGITRANSCARQSCTYATCACTHMHKHALGTNFQGKEEAVFIDPGRFRSPLSIFYTLFPSPTRRVMGIRLPTSKGR